MPKWSDEWDNLKENYPMNIMELVEYCQDFETLMTINLTNTSLAKQRLIKARGKLFLAINELFLMFYDRTIFKKKEDLIIFYWLKDDLNRVLSHLEQKERESLVDTDSTYKEQDRTSLSRITAYYTDLITIKEGIIFSSLKKAKKEYDEAPDEEVIKEKIKEEIIETKIKKGKRSFLYILFLIVSNSVGVFGGIAKEGKLTKKSIIGSIPTTYQSLMGTKGQDFIKDAYEEEKELSNLDDIENLLITEPLEEGEEENV